MLLISQFVKSQVTIASDGLNNSSTLFIVAGGAYFTGNSAAGDGRLPRLLQLRERMPLDYPMEEPHCYLVILIQPAIL